MLVGAAGTAWGILPDTYIGSSLVVGFAILLVAAEYFITLYYDAHFIDEEPEEIPSPPKVLSVKKKGLLDRMGYSIDEADDLPAHPNDVLSSKAKPAPKNPPPKRGFKWDPETKSYEAIMASDDEEPKAKKEKRRR